MIVSSWNMRGLGGRVKKQKLRHLINSQRVEVMAVQGTKLEVIDHKLCSSLWEGDIVGWRYTRALGRSGDILILWDSTKGTCVSSFQEQGYLGVCLEWGIKKSLCLIVMCMCCVISTLRRLFELTCCWLYVHTRPILVVFWEILTRLGRNQSGRGCILY
jgi:hypothetical protein